MSGVDVVKKLNINEEKEKLIKIKKTFDILDLAGSMSARYKRGENIDKPDIRKYMEKNYKRI